MEPPPRPAKRALSFLSPPSSSASTETSTTTSSPSATAVALELKPEPSKEELYASAKAKRIAAINARNAHLESEIERVATAIESDSALLKDKNAAATVKTHIKLLHEYNEIRDVGQGMIGMIADNRGVRIAELYESAEFGVSVKD